MIKANLIPIMLLVLLCCCNNVNDLQMKKISSDNSNLQEQPESFVLASMDFPYGGVIPTDFACRWLGGNNLTPQLHWQNVPSATESFALIMDDETRKQGDKAVKHWAVFNIPASITEFETRQEKIAINGITEGRNYKNTNGYAGPCPPDEHVYSFSVFALKKDMPHIQAGNEFTRSQFKREYGDYIIDSATLSGTFTPSIGRLWLNKIKNILSNK